MKSRLKTKDDRKKKKKRGRKYTLKLSITLPTGEEVCDFFDGIRRGLRFGKRDSSWK